MDVDVGTEWVEKKSSRPVKGVMNLCDVRRGKGREEWKNRDRTMKPTVEFVVKRQSRFS